MPVKLRLQRKGRTKAPFYHIVVANSRDARDGRFIQKLGTYNPLTKPATIDLDREKALDWLLKGAQPTDTVRAILRFKGVYYRKHLLRGVARGAFTMEKANELYEQWLTSKEKHIESRREASLKEIEQHRQRVFGAPKPRKQAPAAPAEETTTEE
jgi:small subunit ribosomal protein S16